MLVNLHLTGLVAYLITVLAVAGLALVVAAAAGLPALVRHRSQRRSHQLSIPVYYRHAFSH